MTEEIRYRIFKILQTNPEISQRKLAKELGISLGQVNYCLQAIIRRGWVKVKNFKNSDNKRAYAYFVTPKGFEEKAKVTLKFFRNKLEEYEALQRELRILKDEIEAVK